METNITIDMTYIGKIATDINIIGDEDHFFELEYGLTLYVDSFGNYYKVADGFGTPITPEELPDVLRNTTFNEAYFEVVEGRQIGMICTGSHMEGIPEDHWIVPEYDLDLYMDKFGRYYRVEDFDYFEPMRGDLEPHPAYHDPNLLRHFEAHLLTEYELEIIMHDAQIFREFLPVIDTDYDEVLPF